MARKRRRKQLPTEHVEADIVSLSHEGRGITRINDKVIFIDGALPGEKVLFKYTSQKSRFDEGQVVEVLKASEDRVVPPCVHSGLCGGCSLQHMHTEAQIRFKQNALLEQLQHNGGLIPETVIPPLTGPTLAYRRKARIGVKYVLKKSRLLIGFREKQGRFLADLQQCEILDKDLGHKITSLIELISGLSAYMHIPQLEVAISDDQIVLILRHLEPLSEDDVEKLSLWSIEHNIVFYLQGAGKDSIKTLEGNTPPSLFYKLDDYNLKMAFLASDFTQVNAAINKGMIRQALRFLELSPEDSVLDLFCGLGNFTLPIAKKVKRVTGVEGDAGLIQRAQENAANNAIENAQFHVADLFEPVNDLQWMRKPCNKLLLDPPRSGALAFVTTLSAPYPERIVYVSCNPATLVRDADILVNQKGYTLTHAGIMDMFPHTAHVESMAVFIKSDQGKK